MSSAERSPRYTVIAIGLHWAIAVLIGFMIWLGWNMDGNEARYQLHKSVGITILLLTVARIVWRVKNPPPELPAEMPPLERRASHLVHIAFYALLVLVPLGGWLMVSVSPFRVPTVLYGVIAWPNLPFTEALRGEGLYNVIAFAHSKAAWLFIGLLALHVAGALKHEFFGEEDGVLKRMLPGLFGKTAGPARPAGGFLAAFGGALALFAIVAGSPMVASALQGDPAASAPQASGGIAANWAVDYDTAEIRFSGIYDGSEFSGTFESWSADVGFYPDDLDASAVEVEIDLTSATTGKKLYDDSLSGREWFDTGNSPTATVTLGNFRAGDPASEGEGSAYIADATLTLKDQTATVPLRFIIDIDSGIANMRGETTLSREALDLGQASDPTGDWVSDEITVTVSGSATPIGG